MNKQPEPEIYTPERIAEFLVNNSLTAEEYRWAVGEVVRLGLDPLRIEHLFRDEAWQDPSLYLGENAMRRSS